MKYFVFDIGGVLNNTQSKEFKRYFTLKNYYNADDEEANNLRKELLGEYMKGKIDFDTLINTMRPYFIDREKSVEDYKKEYKEHLKNTSRLYDKSEETIKRIKDEGYKVYLLSNLTEIDFELFKERFDTTLFNGAFLSYELRLLKPNKAIYDRVVLDIGCDPRSIYYFDDKQGNIDSANECYMNAYLTNGDNLNKDVDLVIKKIKSLEI